MRFRGTFPAISNVQGLQIWLNQRHVLLKHFGQDAQRPSADITAYAHGHGRRAAAAV